MKKRKLCLTCASFIGGQLYKWCALTGNIVKITLKDVRIIHGVLKNKGVI